MIKALLIDDEPGSRDGLRNILNTYCRGDVDVIDTAGSVDEGYEKILEHNPELIFLDIIMPPADGFALLKKFRYIDFQVIFITAYDQYAIQAIKHSALDYILKPVHVSDVVEAVKKAKSRHADRQAFSAQANRRITLSVQGSLVFLEADLIIRAASETGHKSTFFLKQNKQLTVTRDLSEYEPILTPFGFFRTHRSHMVNCAEIKEYVPDRNGGCVIMTDGKLVPVAPKKKDEFLSLFRTV